jgi:hypothetical protein
MRYGLAKFARHKNGLPYFAEVAVSVSPEQPWHVEFRCSGDGYVGQGGIEQASLVGYTDWKAGAAAGVRFACAIAEIPRAHVIVGRISGLGMDTNPSTVAAAAALAVWHAVGFEPAPSVVAQMEAHVFLSWRHPVDYIPNFGVEACQSSRLMAGPG